MPDLFMPDRTAEEDPLKLYPRVMHPHRRSILAVGKLAMDYMLDRRIGAVLTELLGEEPAAA